MLALITVLVVSGILSIKRALIQALLTSSLACTKLLKQSANAPENGEYH